MTARSSHTPRATLAGLILALAAPVFAQYEDVTIAAEPVAEGIYMLTGRGGNIGLSVGEDATFIVDDQYAPLTDRIVAAIDCGFAVNPNAINAVVFILLLCRLVQSFKENKPSKYHFEASIAQAHCSAESVETTDWSSIVKLYDVLLDLHPSPIYRLNRAIALGQNGELQAALRDRYGR